ncbi:TraM recognition domain-containing protein [Sphingomonas sp. 7/4-4]|uniref:type IV secretory system conjugative DNA transfer family protein n=1 Tax=Sphingomonas sp. 7/4-4 TaxID=3018446 RepID=UPI0022F3A8D9|nr:TraM recognition domain-containing protein [Sphingomonas sp. 7/4-4]WBY08944.1 TraM recognition domain-containing protein [Sphingomonas sp. 7/4-4]
MTGGGKTSGPGHNALTGLAKLGAGGVIACAKPSEADEVCAILQKAGRGGSIIRWNGRNGAFNVLAYALARYGPRGINSVIEEVMRYVEIIRNASALRGGDGEAFWLDELKRVLRNTLPSVYLATGTLRLRDILAFARSAPTSLEQMQSEAWQRESFFFAVMTAAAEGMDNATGERLMEFWREYAQMDGKLRGSIVAGFTMLDRLNHGWLGEAFCGETNIVPALCFHGAIIVLDMPRATHGEDGLIGQMLFIDAAQTEVLSRNALDPSQRERLVFFYIDEFQEVVTSRYGEFLALSRSSLCSTIALTQSLPGLYAKLGGPNAHDRAHHLIANMGVRIFCANSCVTTNAWASQTIGKAVQRRASYSESEGTNTSYGSAMNEGSGWSREASDSNFMGHVGGFGWSMDPSWGRNGSESGNDGWSRNRGHGSSQGTSQGYSETVDDIVPAGFFASGLKTGGPANGNRVGALWVQAGKRFAASGGPSRYVEFAQ